MAENDRQSNLLVRSAREFSDDECTMMASSLAYYTIFSLPPLLVIVITVAGWIWGVQPVQEAIDKQVESVVGPQGKEQIHAMIEKANDPKRGTIATIVGIVVLLFGATGVVAQLQFALKPRVGGRAGPGAGRSQEVRDETNPLAGNDSRARLPAAGVRGSHNGSVGRR